jgi:hypothetical protein
VATLTQDEKERLTKAIFDHGDIRARLSLQWVQQLAYLSDKLAHEQSLPLPETQTAFWIRLHGVLVDLYKYYDDCHTLLAGDPSLPPSQIAHEVAQIRAELKAARDAFDDDEKIWIHYRRDTECHIWQDSYELTIHKGKLKEHRTIALLGTVLRIDEINRRSRTLLQKHRIDEAQMAVDFAAKVRPAVARTLVALAPLY